MSGSVSLLGTNDIGTLAANLTGAGSALNYIDANALSVGTVDGVVGITTNVGFVSLTADGTNNVLTVNNAITTGGAGIALIADNMGLNAAINAGAGNVSLRASTAGLAINLGGADATGILGLTAAELNQITASKLTIGEAPSGTILVSAAIAPSGTSVLVLHTGAGISGSGTITIANLLLRSVNAINLPGANDVNTLAVQLTGAGNGFTFADLDDLTIGIVDGVTGLTTNNGAVALTADSLEIQQALNAGTATATFQTFSTGRPISLGIETAGQLSLTDAELDRITAAVLGVGSTTAGAITLSGALTPANVATLSLSSASTVGGAGTITVTNLRITAGGAVTLTGANDVTSLSAFLNGAGQAFSFRDANSFTVGGVDGVTGITTNGGAISLTSGAGGTITVTHPITSGNAAVSLMADDLVLNAALNAGTQIVTLEATTTNRDIDLGSNTAGTLGLTDAELDFITAGMLRIGSTATAGNINLTAAITATTFSVLSLRTSGAITDGTAGEQTDLSVASLALSAGNGIGATNNLNLSVTTLAFSNGNGAVFLANDRALTLGAVDGLAASVNTGTTTTLTAVGGMTFAVNITTAGTLTAVSTETTGAADGLTVNGGVTLQATTGNVVLQAGDLIDIRAGATIQASAGGITLETGFGDNDGSGAITINGALNAATTPKAFGGTGVDTFTINTVTASGLLLDGRQGSDVYLLNLGNLNGPVTINDSGTGDYDQVQINGTSSNETFTITPTQLTVGTNTISYNTALEQLTVNAGAGDDTVTVTPSATMAIVLEGGERRLVNVLNFNAVGLGVTVTGNSFTAAGQQPVTFSNFNVTNLGNAAGALQFPGNLNTNQRFVQSLYYQYLGRLGTTTELDGWAALLSTLGSPGVASAIARSTEAVTRVIDLLYVQILDRQSDPAGQALWVSQLSSAILTLEQIIAGFVASTEFSDRANALYNTGNNDENYVRALYATLLGRGPSDSEVASWVGQLPTVGRTNVALGFLGSSEFRTAAVQSFYGVTPFPAQPFWRNILHRTFTTTTSEITNWVASGLDLYLIESLFAGTTESFTSA